MKGMRNTFDQPINLKSNVERMVETLWRWQILYIFYYYYKIIKLKEIICVFSLIAKYQSKILFTFNTLIFLFLMFKVLNLF